MRSRIPGRGMLVCARRGLAFWYLQRWEYLPTTNRTTSWVLILVHLKRRKETEQQNFLQSDYLPQTPAVLTSLLGWSVTVNHNKPYPSQVACLIVLSQWQDQKLRQHLSDHRWCGLVTSHHLYRAFIGFPYNLQMASWDASSALWD